MGRSAHVAARKVLTKQPVRLTVKERLQRQVRQLARAGAALEDRVTHLQHAIRNDLLGLELDLDAVKYLLVTSGGVTPEQWTEARRHANAIYEARLAAHCAAAGLREWFAGAPAAAQELAAELERHYHPERRAAPEGGDDAGQRGQEPD